MSESGQWRETASCAVLSPIGSRKVPAEARRIPMSPEGVVDAAAVGRKKRYAMSTTFLLAEGSRERTHIEPGLGGPCAAVQMR